MPAQNAKHATLLVADDDPDIRLALTLLFTQQGYRVRQADSPGAVLVEIQQELPDLLLLDLNYERDTTSGQEGLALLRKLPCERLPVILMTAWASLEVAVEGMRLGAADFIEKPWHKEKLLASVSRLLQVGQLRGENHTLKQLLNEDSASANATEWVAESAAMQQLEQRLQQVAATDASVLIFGENGTGKSLLAKRLHQLSGRAEQPMVSLNMASVPENLFESELFGHRKGAFTDATADRTGRFTLANGGSLFLDEIGTLPLPLQPKLLRVLESGEYEVLGSSTTVTADVRIISATNADLDTLVQQGQFRQDLLYRLNTLVLEVPPLRQRQEDILPLAHAYLRQFARQYGKPLQRLSTDAIQALNQYAWPGNVRQLRQTIERAVVVSASSLISAEDFGLPAALASSKPEAQQAKTQPLSLAQAEYQAISAALQATDNIAQAAKLLDISRAALYRRLEKFGLTVSDFPEG